MTQLTRLITNQLIIGKTTYNSGRYLIEQPYEVIPSAEGLQLIPLDEHILGKKIYQINIDMNNTIYSNECSQELTNSYLSTISGIELEPDKKLII